MANADQADDDYHSVRGRVSYAGTKRGALVVFARPSDAALQDRWELLEEEGRAVFDWPAGAENLEYRLLLVDADYVRIGAYLDLDGSGLRDEGEPAGTWEGSFVMQGKDDPTWRDLVLTDEGGGFVAPGDEDEGGSSGGGLCTFVPGAKAPSTSAAGLLAARLMLLGGARARRSRRSDGA